jgi:hypothetical protein
MIIATVGEPVIWVRYFITLTYTHTSAVGCISGLTYNELIKLNIRIDPRVPFSMGAATNILLMCLTGMATHTVAQDSSAELMPQLVESGTYGGRCRL